MPKNGDKNNKNDDEVINSGGTGIYAAPVIPLSSGLNINNNLIMPASLENINSSRKKKTASALN